MKKALMIIAPNNFRDEELFDTKEALEESGIKVIIASTTMSVAKGSRGRTAIPDIKIEQTNVEDYDAVIFVGGSGASVYFNNKIAHKIASNAFMRGKVLAAICIAPSTIANAGLLQGKKATCFSSEIENLKAKGAIYTGKHVEKDGKIITADGPQSAKEFGKTIAKAL
jgi:protease I